MGDADCDKDVREIKANRWMGGLELFGWRIHRQPRSVVGLCSVVLALLATLLVPTPVSAANPTAPRTVVATVDPRAGIDVSWLAPANDGGVTPLTYVVRLLELTDANDDGVLERTLVVRETTTDLALTFDRPPPGEYEVQVRATNADGGSGWVRRTVTVNDPPSAPLDVTVEEESNGQLLVRWSEPATDGGTAITGYRVTLDGAARNLGSARRSVRFTGVANAAHVVTVVAINSVGESPAVTVEISTLKAPGSPQQVAHVVDGQNVTISWNPPADDGGELVDYEVELGTYRASAAGGSITISGVAAADYQLRVRARNSTGSGPWASGGTVSVRTIPTPPRVVRLEVEDRGLVVSWLEPDSDGNSPITGYRVDFGDSVEIVDGTSVTRPNVRSGDWVVTVSAINEVGESTSSSSRQVAVSRLFEPFDSADDFVTQVYRDFLGRSPDRSGLDYWAGRLDDEADMAPAIVSFVGAPEMDPERRVARLYLALFDRAPDQGGFLYWIDRYENGQSIPSIADSFVGSPEFLARFGALDNGQFVVLVYNRILARQPDRAGYNYWVSRLEAGVPRGELIALFSESAEFVALSRPAVDLIVIYSGLLDRTPSPAELRSALQIVTDTGSLEPVIDDVLRSTEYRNRILTG